MAKYANGQFVPKNPEKYVGNGLPHYRSSWELTFFQFCDNHPNIINWASEAIKIPYKNPLTGKNTIYVPDLFIMYQDANGVRQAEIIEIKPASQAYLEEARSRRDKLSLAVNAAKWQACQAFCKNQGLVFRVVTERQLYAGTKPPKQPKKRK